MRPSLPPQGPPSPSPPASPLLPVVSDQALAQSQFAEDVHHDLHGGVVGDGEGAHVQDAAQLEGAGAVGGEGGGVLGKVHPRVTHDALLLTPGVLCTARQGDSERGGREREIYVLFVCFILLPDRFPPPPPPFTLTQLHQYSCSFGLSRGKRRGHISTTNQRERIEQGKRGKKNKKVERLRQHRNEGSRGRKQRIRRRMGKEKNGRKVAVSKRKQREG